MFFVWFVFFFKHETAYEMRISDWSSDVCSSDLFELKVPNAETRAAADRHVARAEQADVGLAGRIRLDIARAGDRDVERRRDEPVGVDIARAGHVDLARYRGAALDVQVARARHGQFQDRKSTRLNSSH